MNQKQENSRQRVTPCGKLILFCCKILLALIAIPLLFFVPLFVFHSATVQRFIDDIRLLPHILIPAERETDLIAFVCGGFATDLYTIHPDGSQLRLMDEGHDMTHSQLKWSPDGSWIAFNKKYQHFSRLSRLLSLEPIASAIYLVRFDGFVSRRLTYHFYDVRNLRWSDDGRAIYYETQRRFSNEPPGHSYAVNHSGRAKQVELSNHKPPSLHTVGTSSSQFSADELASASLSPTGEWLAVVSPSDGHSAHGVWIKLSHDVSASSWRSFFLYLQDMDTGRVIRFVNDVIHPNGVSWSPDGEWLAFVTWEKGRLFKIRPDGTSLTQLTDIDCRVTEVSWSPT